MSYASRQTSTGGHAYAPRGGAARLVALEPLTGTRLGATSRQRTKADYGRCLQRVAALFAQAEQISLVPVNRNTHTASSFYEHVSAANAVAWAQRFAMQSTPTKASWLTIAAVE